MALDFKHASAIEGVRFSTQIAIPGVITGLFRKRTGPSKVTTALDAEKQAYKLIAGLVKKYGADPFYVRVVKEEALLVHHPDDIKFVLGESPTLFASDPDAKKKGMSAFQPDALTISRGDTWKHRRQFAEAVLDSSKPLHRLSKQFLVVADEEAAALAHLGGQRPIEWDDINQTFQRITRRVVFGDKAADDGRISDQLAALMSAGNKMPGAPAEGYDEFIKHIQSYVDSPAEGSLASLIAKAPLASDDSAASQVVHWLFAMGDTLPMNLFRTLALLATHPDQLAEAVASVDAAKLDDPTSIAGLDYLGGAIQDTMRLFPTTALFGRVTIEDVRFPGGQTVAAGTQVLIYNLFNHRNRERVAFADRFAPEEWVSGDAGSDWTFNFFSHGPQGCPGYGLSMFLAQAVLARILSEATPTLASGSIDSKKPLPYHVDLYGLKIALKPLD